MIKHVKILEEALSLFSKDERGMYIVNSFNDVPHSLRLLDILENECQFDRSFFRQAWQDVWNISVFIERVEWLRQGVIEGAIEENRWRVYTQVDIASFHVEIRSVMDYVSQIIADFSGMKGKLPSSFNKLQQRLEKYNNKLDPQIYNLVKGATWFSDMRHIRDSLVHFGGDTLVFPGVDKGILFQIHKENIKNEINNELFLYNQNIAYFEKYAALYFAELIVFLNSIGEFCFQSLPKRGEAGSRYYAQGFGVAYDWISKLRNELKMKMELEKNA